MLHPFGLDSKTHLSLVCDKEPLSKRTALTNNQIKSTKISKNLEKEYKDIEDLYQRYLVYLDPESLFPSQEELDNDKESLRKAYQKALPKIAKLKHDKN